MNYKDQDNIDEFHKFRQKTINSISNLLSEMTDSNYKQAANLTYWIRDYVNFLKQEKTFESKYLPKYEYGSIVEVDFGYNIGNELSGSHYAIVMNKKDNKSNPMSTVIPMTSSKAGKKIHENEVDLSNEFYLAYLLKSEEAVFAPLEKNRKYCYIAAKYHAVTGKIKDLNLSEETTNEIIASIDDFEQEFPDEKINENEIEEQYYKSLPHSEIQLKKDYEVLKNYIVKLGKMKEGGRAIITQITSISKMRIKNPKSHKDALFGIKLSEETMEKIEHKMLKLL